ncbi:PD40 domain-containing protein [Sphingomonas profundi]|uniref:PD40 domain-containing protein n=1 Tax=Alterirhizorhabdus profundi TaxID=2681549 RepID=UPI0018D14CAB|nr:PD40 domain-containing protein [Sphingomonas profundi]
MGGAGAAPPAGIDFTATRPGDPLRNLPPGARFISSFGERAAFSPDGKKIAFIGKSYGDAFEYDIATGKTRNLTVHAANAGFLRVQYLNDGNLLLLGPRRIDPDRMAMRIGQIELWYMDKAPGSALQPLNEIVSEGIALSRMSNKVGWAVLEPKRSTADQKVDEYTALRVGDVVVREGTARLENVREIGRRPTSQCVQEAQDFRDRDRELTISCYDVGGKRLSLGKFVSILHSTIEGVRLSDGKYITYHDVRDGSFTEVEGIHPSGAWTMVECGPGEGEGLDLCRLDLVPNGRLTRLTHFLDYGKHRVSNPVVSPDGGSIAFQFGRAGDEAGVGMGILLMPMPAEAGK